MSADDLKKIFLTFRGVLETKYPRLWRSMKKIWRSLVLSKRFKRKRFIFSALCLAIILEVIVALRLLFSLNDYIYWFMMTCWALRLIQIVVLRMKQGPFSVWKWDVGGVLLVLALFLFIAYSVLVSQVAMGILLIFYLILSFMGLFFLVLHYDF